MSTVHSYYVRLTRLFILQEYDFNDWLFLTDFLV